MSQLTQQHITPITLSGSRQGNVEECWEIFTGKMLKGNTVNLENCVVAKVGGVTDREGWEKGREERAGWKSVCLERCEPRREDKKEKLMSDVQRLVLKF